MLGQLIIGIALVHGVAGQAGDFPALETRRFNQGAVVAARDANHAVGPKGTVQGFRVLAEFFGKARIAGDAGKADHNRSIILQFFAWAVAEAVDHPIGIVANVFHAVAGTANFRAAARIEARWVDDGGVAFAAGVESVTAKGIAIFLHVLVSGAVAGFASDAQFGDFGLEDVALWVLERFASGRVATDATAVPDLDHARGLS